MKNCYQFLEGERREKEISPTSYTGHLRVPFSEIAPLNFVCKGDIRAWLALTGALRAIKLQYTEVLKFRGANGTFFAARPHI